jgi:hypothetical protein
MILCLTNENQIRARAQLNFSPCYSLNEKNYRMRVNKPIAIAITMTQKA